MTGIASYNQQAMSDKAYAKMLGDFVKHHRIAQNKTQDSLAKAAGISRSTLSLLEKGETVTLATFIQVLRVLDQLQVLSVFEIQQSASPLALAKLEQEERQRVRPKKKAPAKKRSNW